MLICGQIDISMTNNEQLEAIVNRLPSINNERQYWLIRTEGGKNYDTFYENKFIALQYDVITYAEISKVEKETPASLNETIKKRVAKEYPDDSRPGLIANQIIKFIYEIKKDDIVLIPSANSQTIAFGVVEQDNIYLPSEQELTETDCEYTFRKKVKWLKTANRKSLDPYLYKVLFAHQAINNLNDYNEVIERSIQNFFITDGEAHIIFDVLTTSDIYAIDLFMLGTTYLSNLKDVSDHFSFDLDVNEIEVRIALNSPGKIHFKANSWKTIVTFGIIVLAINGGGLKIDESWGKIDLSTDGIIKNIIDYQNSKHDRNVQDTLLSKYADSLNVQMPTDLILMLQQASTNKGKPDVNLTDKPEKK